mmetsp:Transcript_123323/g.343970  ORF Transcript_123323/g.343970 Transcript_123323/m.343970 type:complete len:317 (+) Transcript_123323:52-1002(+)
MRDASGAWGKCATLLGEATRTKGSGAHAASAGEDLDWDEEGQLLTASQLVARHPSPMPTGLGAPVDALLGGGLRPGQILEVFGPAGVGKTQLALTLAVHAATLGAPVILASAKDCVASLARRLRDISASDAPLSRIRLFATSDFRSLASLLSVLIAENSQATGASDSGVGSLAPLLVVDMATVALAPFTSAGGPGSRWRVPWVWRAMRQLCACGFRVLLLSHTVGAARSAGSASTQLALGAAWAAWATLRMELLLEGGRPGEAGQRLALIARRGRHCPEGSRAPLLLNATGVRPETMRPAAPLGALQLGPCKAHDD